MLMTARGPYEDQESTTTKWLVIFVLLSLLAHAIIIAVILLITVFMPVPKMAPPEPPSPSVTLSLQPAPAPVRPPMPHFMVTAPEPNAPHKQQLIQSANDHELTSKSKTARAPDSVMPDVVAREHAANLNESPNVQAPQTPQVSSTPPTPKQAKPEKPTPPQPNPQQGKQNPSPPTPPKPPSPIPPKKAEPTVDPLTGLPVLPPLNVPTMAPPNSAAQPLAPAPSQLEQAQSAHGALGRQGNNSPAAMQTELGKYKQYVYSVVGSHWYPDINQHFGIIGVGMVHIQFTIHSDGRITDITVLEGDNLQTLRDISHNSLLAPAPFKPFNDALIKQVGDSYTDDFTFSVY